MKIFLLLPTILAFDGVYFLQSPLYFGTLHAAHGLVDGLGRQQVCSGGGGGF